MSVLPSILITDDDLDFRETLRFVFEPRGFRTLLAGDGEEALEIMRGEQVHLVLLDVHMPQALRAGDAAAGQATRMARADHSLVGRLG